MPLTKEQRRINEIKRLQARIERRTRRVSDFQRLSVADAIRIAELIAEQKAEGHGELGPWLKRCGLERRTANNYLDVFKYRDQIGNVSNLSEAYRRCREIRNPKPEPDPNVMVVKVRMTDAEHEMLM